MENIAKKIYLESLKQGGGSFDETGKNKKYLLGYQISTFDGFILETKEEKEVLNAINLMLTFKPKNNDLGVWIDGDCVYIDFSKRYFSLFHALYLGVWWNQKSIFSHLTKRTINTNWKENKKC